eukprot:jgi/Antlo1/1683/330
MKVWPAPHVGPHAAQDSSGLAVCKVQSRMASEQSKQDSGMFLYLMLAAIHPCSRDQPLDSQTDSSISENL